jgi:hypothetical protein
MMSLKVNRMKRECINDIINLLHKSSDSEKEMRIKMIKQEFKLDMTHSPSVVIKKLHTMRRKLDEIHDLNNNQHSPKKSNLMKKSLNDKKSYKMKQLRIELSRIPCQYNEGIWVAREETIKDHSPKETNIFENKIKKSSGNNAGYEIKPVNVDLSRMPCQYSEGMWVVGPKAKRRAGKGKTVTWWDGYGAS